MMSNAKKVFNVWFVVWLAITIILSGTMLITGWKFIASYVLAAFLLMPVRDWCYRFLVWGIDYLSSISTKFKDFINPKATLNTLLEPKKRQTNVGFYRFLKFTTLFLSVVLALLCLIFDETSFNIVYNKLHTIEFLFKGQIGYANILMYLLSDVACFIAVYYIVNRILNEEYITSNTFDTKKFLQQILILVGTLMAKLILTGIFLKFTLVSTLNVILLWLVIIVFILLSCYLANFIYKNFSNDKKNKKNNNDNNNNSKSENTTKRNNSSQNDKTTKNDDDDSVRSKYGDDNVIDVDYVEVNDSTEKNNHRPRRTMSFTNFTSNNNEDTKSDNNDSPSNKTEQPNQSKNNKKAKKTMSFADFIQSEPEKSADDKSADNADANATNSDADK